MRLVAALLPADAAGIVEAVLPLLAAIEQAATPEEREERLAATREWLVRTATELRKADGRGKPQSVPKGQPEATEGRADARRALAGVGKKPCGCEDPKPASPPARSRALGEQVARYVLEKLGAKL